jgi:hypothetical protein
MHGSLGCIEVSRRKTWINGGDAPEEVVPFRRRILGFVLVGKLLRKATKIGTQCPHGRMGVTTGGVATGSEVVLEEGPGNS